MDRHLFCKTVGHSNLAADRFVALLRAHGIACVADVRSVPYSRHNPQFNRETLRTDLQIEDIAYLYMGDCLGARYADPSLLLPGGRADFAKVMALPRFQDGIRELMAGLENGPVTALMCAEKDPFECHRFMLVSRALARLGVGIEHIVAIDRTVPQKELEERLISKYCGSSRQPGLFEQPKSRAELLEDAYEKRNRAW